MSRRYGRNQKKKHVARIELLNSHLVNSIDDNKYLSQRVNTLSKQLSTAENDLHRICSSLKKICGYSVLLPAETINANADYDFRVRAVKPLPPFSMFDPDLDPGKLMYEFADISTHRLEAYLTDNYEALSKTIHLRLRGTDNYVAYNISRDALMFIPEDQKIKMISDICMSLFDKIGETNDKMVEKL